MQSFLKVYCSKIAIDPSLIASSADLEILVKEHLLGELDADRLPVLQGWRHELVGARVLAFLKGEIAVRLDPKTALPIIEDL